MYTDLRLHTMQALPRSSFLQLLFQLAIACLIHAVAVSPVWALTPKKQYHQAETTYAALKKSPRHQKYRDKWLKCIEQYNKVYRLDPSGPWAAAGLYRSGLLYLELHKRSYLGSDKQAAVNQFRHVIRRFPQSRYTPKAKTELSKLGKPTIPPKTKIAAKKLSSAHAAYDRLLKSPKKQKYRDQWESCINLYRLVYKADPQGPHSAESLYMIGVVYEGLSKKSLRKSDQDSSMEYYRRVQQEFPDSASDKKAYKKMGGEKTTGIKRPKNTVDPVASIIEKSRKDLNTKSWNTKGKRSGLVSVKDLRFWSNPSYTRIVIDADRETPFSHRLLKKDPSIKKPQRLYIDMKNSRLDENIRKIIPINDQLLSDARAGQYTEDTVRIVVDIKSFKHYKIFSLKNPFRIVLDVWGQETRKRVAGSSSSPVFNPSMGKIPPGAIARQLALGVSRIVIDPGHGGKDYGAPGYLKGVHEKDIVLQIAKRLARKVESELKCDAVLTRKTDRYLTLEERTAIANTQNADLFISIHTNAVRNKRAYGIETYYLNLATDDDAILVAARENATSAKNISDLESILNDLMQNAKINESSRLATMVQTEMCLHLKKKFKHIRNKGVKQAPFYVLLGAQMPALLVETSFISNPRECKRLTTKAYQEELCNGIIKGIRKYIKETNPTAFNTLPMRLEKSG